MSRLFHWTPNQIDEIELDMILDYTILLSSDAESDGGLKYIEDIMPT